MSSFNEFYLHKVKTVGKLYFNVTKDSDKVESCYRKAVFTNLKGNTVCYVDLWNDNALLELKEGQLVMADLQFKSLEEEGCGEYIEEFRARKIIPLKNDIDIKFVEDDEKYW